MFIGISATPNLSGWAKGQRFGCARFRIEGEPIDSVFENVAEVCAFGYADESTLGVLPTVNLYFSSACVALTSLALTSCFSRSNS